MRARHLAVPLPILQPCSPAAEAARLLASERVDGILVVDQRDRLLGVVTDTTVLIETTPDGENPQVLWWSLALGADLGGNATAIGASANVVVLGLADRAGHRIRFLEFARYGAQVAAVTMAISMLYLWLRYFALA